MAKKIQMFLDSGAYSAMTQKLSININEYIGFIKDNYDVISYYANLDVIGSAEKTLENHKIMQDAGLNPLPVFHLSEDPKFLLNYMETNDYIAVGGAAGKLQGPALRRFLDRIWVKYLLTDEGFAKVKIHGFGITAIPLLHRYPWFSVDSTSWCRSAGVGIILVPYPNEDGSGWDYTRTPHSLDISERSKFLQFRNKHFENYPEPIRISIQKYLKEKNLDLDLLRTNYKERISANAIYFLSVQNSIDTDRSFNFLRTKQSGFFK